MRRVKDKTTNRHGTTLVELTLAVAIMATVFVAVMPLFAGVRNSAETRWARLEMVQAARVLNEQLGRHLAAASRITAASVATSDNGYLEFETADGVPYRCSLGAGGDVEFGPVGDLYALAGPVDYLRVACYDGDDLIHPTSTPERAQLVTWEVGLRSAGPMTPGRVLHGACYLRVVGGKAPAASNNGRIDKKAGAPLTKRAKVDAILPTTGNRIAS